MRSSNLEKPNSNPQKVEHAGDSDIVSFWLLLLFIALFFGIAAEEARRPMFVSATKNPFASEEASFDTRKAAGRNLDLLSVEQERATGPIGRRGENFEVPATGK